MKRQQVAEVPELPNAADFRAALLLRPENTTIERFRRSGAWRKGTALDDLARWREETPDALAITAHEAGSGVVELTYREYADHVDRFACALYELGVRPGQVVAVQLPNRWQVGVLVLACARIGAVMAPVMTTIRPRELVRILRRLEAVVCISIDRWAGFDHSSALAELGPHLPDLRHRIVLGDTIGEDEVDFVEHFQQTPWEQTHANDLNELSADPDQVGFVLFTSGTSGEPKAALHTLNTIYAGSSALANAENHGPQDVFFSPGALTHLGAMVLCVFMPLLVGGGGVVMDVWEPETAAALLAETNASFLAGVPVFLSGLVAELRRTPRPLPALRFTGCFGTMIPEHLITGVADVLGLPLRTAFAMTETTGVTLTRRDDPADWAAHSVGRPISGIELDLRSDAAVTAEQPARLFIRGSTVCLATVGRDSGEVIVTGEHDDGWYDTGDLAVPDGRGGIRLLGRAGDRIGGPYMIPVSDVETAVLDHPRVDEVALVGYPDGEGGELACAVIVSRTTPPTITELRKHLDDLRMTEWYQPSRVEALPVLPYNSVGKVRKELLRRWLRGEADLDDVNG